MRAGLAANGPLLDTCIVGFTTMFDTAAEVAEVLNTTTSHADAAVRIVAYYACNSVLTTCSYDQAGTSEITSSARWRRLVEQRRQPLLPYGDIPPGLGCRAAEPRPGRRGGGGAAGVPPAVLLHRGGDGLARHRSAAAGVPHSVQLFWSAPAATP